MRYPPTDLTGVTFHQLTGIRFANRYYVTSGGHRKRIWLFQCDCGNQKEIVVEKVKKGEVKSCGCRRGKYTGTESLAYAIFGEQYMDGDLTFEDFYRLSQEPCFYCGSLVSQSGSIRKARTKTLVYFQYHGLDRLDSSQPHNLDNVQPSCWVCNQMKRNYSFSMFLEKIQAIYHNRLELL